MHRLTVEVSGPPRPRASPATRTRLNQYICLCRCAEEEKEGGGIVCGTQESDRTSPLALAEVKVCSRAVLPGRDCAKHKTAGSLPQPWTKATATRNDLGRRPAKRTSLAARALSPNRRF